MKNFICLFLMLVSAASFSQNSGMVLGKVMDHELNNEPLVFANVSVKGTTITAQTDLTGMFLIEDLEAGDYTLVCSFVGYETKEINVHVDAFNSTEVETSLAASTISADELAMLSNLAKNEADNTTSQLN